MKWPPMKLRTRLFLSISALVTVALLGLLLGLVSVLQMATVQQQLVRETTPCPGSGAEVAPEPGRTADPDA